MFILLLIAQACSLTGGYVQTLVLSWVAASLSGGLYSLSAYMIACYLPVAVLSYPFGRWLDKRPQKGWLVASEVVLAGLSFLLWQAAARDWLSFPFLLIFGSVWGVVRAFQTPIYQSLPRRLAKELSKGTALLTVVTYAARGLGPILGGLLYAKWGAAVPFLVNFCSFIPSVILLCFLKLPAPSRSKKTKVRRWLPALTRIFLTSFFGVNYNVTFVALVKEAGLGSGSYGLAMGLLGGGALFGFFLKSKIKKELSPEVFLPGMGALNLALAVLPNIWLQGICIFLYGVLDFWYFATASVGLSGKAEKEEITSVMGLYTVVTVGAMPVGALFWSFAAKKLGLAVALCIIGGGLLLMGLLEKGTQHEARKN
ncbi:MAG: MFS transporter [Clostridia bacterium]|nr:MFS transporter [Clostridia bacterium]